MYLDVLYVHQKEKKNVRKIKKERERERELVIVGKANIRIGSSLIPYQRQNFVVRSKFSDSESPHHLGKHSI